MNHEKPIIFSTPMVRAILAGHKTQTRRVVKPQLTADAYKLWNWEISNVVKKHRKYQPCDILWVRETWTLMEPKNNEGSPFYLYKGDEPDCESSPWFSKWRPSIHMPRSVARIFLRVTDVRAERLREISEADAIAEGCNYGFHDDGVSEYIQAHTPEEQFAALWDSLNAKRGFGWESNPWVWKISFERVEA